MVIACYRVTNVHPAAIFTPQGSPASPASVPTVGSLLCATGEFGGNFPRCPFWMVSFEFFRRGSGLVGTSLPFHKGVVSSLAVLLPLGLCHPGAGWR